jgi:hypothetical protein
MKEISVDLKNFLIDHIDKDVPIHKDDFRRWRRQLALVRRGYLRFDRSSFPTMTKLTEGGRDALCRALAEHADVLVRAAEAGAFDWRQAMQVHALLATAFGGRFARQPEADRIAS